MGKRRKARESTLQILFQLEFDNPQPEKAIKQYWRYRRASKEIRSYSDLLVEGIRSHQEEIDALIQSVVDTNVTAQVEERLKDGKRKVKGSDPNPPETDAFATALEKY